MRELMILASTLAFITVAAFLTGCGPHGAKEQVGNPASSASVGTLNESNFDSETQSGVVLVDFWATWCGPCKLQAPIVAEVAGQFEGKAKVAKLDVDAAPKIAQRFNIAAIPTLVVFKDGKPLKQFVGITKAEKLIPAINAALDTK